MKRESSRPFVLPAGSSEAFPDTLAEFLQIADAKGFLENDGTGGLRWTPASIAGGVTGSLGEVGDALQLFWLYGDQSPNFELFSPLFRFRDIAPVAVLEATAGDDTLDLATTEGLKVGSTYVIHDAAGTLIETIEVSKILTPKRLRTRLSLGQTLAAAAGAKLARTSAEVLDRFAIFGHGDAFYTRVLDALRLQDRGRLMLRRSSDGTGTFAISYRLAGDTAWVAAKRTEVRSRRTGTRDEEYEIAIGGEIELRITYAGANPADRERVEFMLLGTVPRNDAAAWVEQPVNAAPASQAINVGQTPTLTGSAYRSLYGLDQGGAHFQVARDALFTDVVVNSSNDWLASWVNKTGYSQAWKGVVALAANKFLAVADGVSVRLDQTGTISNTGTVAGDLRCVAAATGLAVAAGAAGAIRTSADEGATYTSRTAANAYGGTFNGAAVRGSRVALVGTGAEIQFAANSVIFAKVAADGAYAGDFTAIAGDGAGNVIAVGTLGGIQTSNTDGQSGWTKREAPGGYTGIYRAAALLPSGYGLAAGDNGALHETFDYGATWRNATPDPAFAGRFTAVAIAGAYAVVVGEGGAIQVKTLPNGKWQARSAGGGSSGAFRALALDANADAIALGDAGLVQRTSRLVGATITYTVPAGSDMLATNKVYFWRVRYCDTLNRWSPWSVGTAFATSAVFNYVRQPDNLSPANGDDAVSTVPSLQAGAFSVVGTPDTHAKSRWQVARDQAFADIAHDSGEVNDLTTYTLPAGSPLADQVTFFWRVAYKGTTNGLSAWSAPTSFKTRARPNKPVITAPAADATNVAIAPTITTAAFSMPGGGVHDASRYQVSTTSSFASFVYDSGWTTADKLSHTLPAGKLAFGTLHYVRVQHRESGGQVSAYSAIVAFTTVAIPKVQDVFATTLWSPNGALQNIAAGFAPDLSWQKTRAGPYTRGHYLFNRLRPGKHLASNESTGEQPTTIALTATGANTIGDSGSTQVSWFFKRAERFFDIVFYEGDGVAGRQIPHGLKIKPGLIIVKRVDASANWAVQHIARGSTKALFLNGLASESSLSYWSGEPSDTQFGVGGYSETNAVGGQYIAYLFAHDPDPSGIIQCGQYDGNGSSTGPLVTLGWEPQLVLIKQATSTNSDWHIYDNKRNLDNPRANPLRPNDNGAELTSGTRSINFSAPGFQPMTTGNGINNSGATDIYMAVRKGAA